MAEIQVRPLALADIAVLAALDPSYHTDYVWQMDVQHEEGELAARFREVRLPRSMRVDYPRNPQALAEDWKERPAVLAAERDGEVIGYVSLAPMPSSGGVTVSDLVVGRRFRRQGAGSALVRGAQTWAKQQGYARLILEMQSKNHPAIRMAVKLGFEFCGYNDRYFANQDIALFFARSVG
ncbi:MAG: GNAT family N-acetyltransferase [Chloroflexi bacterium]|nr:GNAT family N-acetyltransferase [Chloroflexota bacterium]